MSWLRLWILGAVKPVGQLYGSPTALTSQYLAWDRYSTYVVQTPRVERRLFLEQIRPTVAPEQREEISLWCKHEVCWWINILLCIETKQANIWKNGINSLFKFKFLCWWYQTHKNNRKQARSRVHTSNTKGFTLYDFVSRPSPRRANYPSWLRSQNYVHLPQQFVRKQAGCLPIFFPGIC